MEFERLYRSSGAALFLAALLSACGQKEPAVEVISIVMLEDQQHCLVGKQGMACAEVSNYLRQQLHVGQDALLLVSVDKTGPKVSNARDFVAELKQAGFTRVGVAGFISEPEQESVLQQTPEEHDENDRLRRN